MEINGDWRPEDWKRMRAMLANKPAVWSPSKPSISPVEQIIEAAASLILEEFINANENIFKRE